MLSPGSHGPIRLLTGERTPPWGSAAMSLGALLLAACSQGSPDEPPARSASEELVVEAGEVEQPPVAAARPPQPPPAALALEQDCLVLVWEAQDRVDEVFDREHDDVAGGAISCATGSSASQFEATLAALRDAARARDRSALLRELDIPLLYIDAEGTRREITEADLVSAAFEEVFSPEMLEVMAQIRLEDMTVVPDEGAFFELGSLWLVVDAKGGRPKLVTVNRQALDEAIRAAREAADEGHGTPIELPATDTRA